MGLLLGERWCGGEAGQMQQFARQCLPAVAVVVGSQAQHGVALRHQSLGVGQPQRDAGFPGDAGCVEPGPLVSYRLWAF